MDLGAGSGHVSKHLDTDICQSVLNCELSEKLLFRDQHLSKESQVSVVKYQQMDEEHLTFPPNSLEAVVSSMSMHWVNDLPGTLSQIHRALRPDAPFIGAMMGGDTLFELRCSLQLAEQERKGGLSPHISPFATAPDLSGLLLRAGFSLTTVDIDEIVVQYPSMFELIEDLKAMAENSALIGRKPVLSRDVLMAASAIYQEMYGKTDENGVKSVPATFQVLYMIGWKPDPRQPKPLARGSGKVSMKDISNEKK